MITYTELSRIRSALDPITKRTLSREELQPMRIDCSTVPLDEDTDFCSLCPANALDQALADIDPEEKATFSLPDRQEQGSDDDSFADPCEDDFYTALRLGRHLLRYFSYYRQEFEAIPTTEWSTVG